MMSTNEAQLKFELKNEALGWYHQHNEHTYALPPDKVESAVSKDEVIQFNFNFN